jgi:hypothetical protein
MDMPDSNNVISTVSYWLSKHGGVAHAYVLRGSVLRPIAVIYCTWLSTIINILLYSPSLIAAVGYVVKSWWHQFWNRITVKVQENKLTKLTIIKRYIRKRRTNKKNKECNLGKSTENSKSNWAQFRAYNFIHVLNNFVSV